MPEWLKLYFNPELPKNTAETALVFKPQLPQWVNIWKDKKAGGCDGRR